jgi:hypothetical protein
MKLRELKLIYSDNELRRVTVQITSGFHEGKSCVFQDWRGANAIVKLLHNEEAREGSVLLAGNCDVVIKERTAA